MAEALTVHLTGGAVEARSAGSNPKPLHANAVRVMQRRGLDIADRPSKHLDRFVGQRFDAVITLCDRVRRVCPRFPNAAEQLHWSLPDPSLAGPDDDASYPVFERLAGELEVRIGFRFHPSTSAPHTEPRRSVHVPR
jgi:protein-tyrosine-phosphatase